MNEKLRCITLVGTASIQDYLFRSNRLKENLGGSYLVGNSTRDFAKNHGGELIYCGGGNAAVVFQDADVAKNAVYSWSKKLLQDAPGLRVVAGHAEIVEGKLQQAYKEATQQLFLCENHAPFGSPLGALPVVKTCASTGLAADVEYEDPTTGDRTWLSDEANKKRTTAETANSAFKANYGDALKIGERFKKIPIDFDNLGQQEGAAQIAVVHIDGNGIGKLFSELTRQRVNDDDFRKKLKDLSTQITQLAKEAFQHTLEDLSTLLGKKEEKLSTLGIYLKGKYYPVRPIVDGGDDLTFVCQGKLGIPLAIRYLRLFEEKSQSIVGNRLTACAGVAIVHQSFPFAHAYQLAEELTSSAKRRRNTVDEEASWIDFEMVREGTLGSLDKLRRDLRGNLSVSRESVSREKDKKYSLLCRPYRVGTSSNEVYDWSSFVELWQTFGGTESLWPRSLAKQLLEMLADDPVLPKSLFTEAEKRGHVIPGSEKLRNGWDEGSLGDKRLLFPLYDPLDLIDLYADIEWMKPGSKHKGAQ